MTTLKSRTWSRNVVCAILRLKSTDTDPIAFIVDPVLDRAEQLFQRGKPDKALRFLTDAIRLHPDAAELLCARGSMYEYLDRGKKAQADYEAAIRADNMCGEAWGKLGQFYTDADRLDDAMQLGIFECSICCHM